MTPNFHISPDNNYRPQWDRYTKILVTLILLVAGVYALTLLAPVFQLLAFAFIVAFLMYSPARFLTRYTPVPWAAAVGLLYLLLIIVIFFIILIFSPALVRGLNSLVQSGETAYAEVQKAMVSYKSQDGVLDVFGTKVDLNPVITPVRNFVLGTPEGDTPATASNETVLVQSVDLRQVLDSFVNVAGTLTTTLTTAIGSVAGFLSTLLLAIFISALVLIDLPNNREALEKWIPTDYQREIRVMIQKIVYVWNGFFRGQVAIGIIIGGITYAQLKIMGITNAELLAVVVGLISLIPTIGGIIALLPLGLVPLLQGSTVLTGMNNLGVAVLVVLVNLIINQIIWNVIAPKILGDALNLPLSFIIVGVFIGAALGGVLGAFLVAPIMGTVRIVVVYALNKLSGRDPFPEPAPKIEAVQHPTHQNVQTAVSTS